MMALAAATVSLSGSTTMSTVKVAPTALVAVAGDKDMEAAKAFPVKTNIRPKKIRENTAVFNL